ncbi:hypothetical protein BDV11DRAFT_7006 [Aspergillus similis]
MIRATTADRIIESYSTRSAHCHEAVSGVDFGLVSSRSCCTLGRHSSRIQRCINNLWHFQCQAPEFVQPRVFPTILHMEEDRRTGQAGAKVEHAMLFHIPRKPGFMALDRRNRHRCHALRGDVPSSFLSSSINGTIRLTAGHQTQVGFITTTGHSRNKSLLPVLGNGGACVRQFRCRSVAETGT